MTSCEEKTRSNGPPGHPADIPGFL